MPVCSKKSYLMPSFTRVRCDHECQPYEGSGLQLRSSKRKICDISWNITYGHDTIKARLTKKEKEKTRHFMKCQVLSWKSREWGDRKRNERERTILAFQAFREKEVRKKNTQHCMHTLKFTKSELENMWRHLIPTWKRCDISPQNWNSYNVLFCMKRDARIVPVLRQIRHSKFAIFISWNVSIQVFPCSKWSTSLPPSICHAIHEIKQCHFSSDLSDESFRQSNLYPAILYDRSATLPWPSEFNLLSYCGMSLCSFLTTLLSTCSTSLYN